MDEKKVPRIAWELGVLGLMIFMVFAVQFMAPLLVSGGGQFIRTYSSGSANFNLTIVQSGVEGNLSSSSYSLSIISGDSGSTMDSTSYKLLIGSGQLIYPTTAIVGPPQFFDHVISPSDAVYSGLQIYQFSAKILGESDIDYVKFTLYKSNGEIVFYTLGSGIDKIGDIYTANFAYLSAGNYTYEWFARDLSGRTAKDQIRPYNIRKASPGLNMTFDGVESSIAVSKGPDVTIRAIAKDNSDLSLILFINGVNVINNVGTIEYIFKTADYQNGFYNIRTSVIGNENWSDETITRNITLASVGYSDVQVNPLNGSVFKPVQLYRFSAKWSGDVSDVILEFNGVNYSYNKRELVKTGTTYMKDLGNLSAGSYVYRWHSNDTIGTITKTEPVVYEIKKAPTITKLFIGKSPGNDSSESSKVYAKDVIVNLTTIIDVQLKQLSLKFYKPDGSLSTGSGITRYERFEVLDQTGLYKIISQFDGDQNYSNSNVIKWIVVPSGADSTAPEFTDQNQSTARMFEGQNITVWMNVSDPSLVDYIKVNMNDSGAYNTKETAYANAPYYRISFTWSAPIGTAGRTIGWMVSANDSFNNMATSTAGSFVVYDWADENYDKLISMAELSRAISKYLGGKGTQLQIASTIQRWLNGGLY